MFRVSETLRITHGQDGSVVLDIRHGRMLRLNTTGSLIFKRLQEGQTESQIIDEISQEFCICYEIVQTDVSEFLKSLEQPGFVHNNTPEELP